MSHSPRFRLFKSASLLLIAYLFASVRCAQWHGSAAIEKAARVGLLTMEGLKQWKDGKKEIGSVLEGAARGGHKELTEAALRRQPTQEQKDDAFLGAAREGHVNVCDLLWQNGADLGQIGDNAHVGAAEGGHVEIARFLIDHRARGTSVKAVRIANATGNEHVKMVQFLLDEGVSVHEWHDEALYRAILGGHVDVVQLLLNNGADVEARGKEFLQKATEKGNKEIVHLVSEKSSRRAWFA